MPTQAVSIFLRYTSALSRTVFGFFLGGTWSIKRESIFIPVFAYQIESEPQIQRRPSVAIELSSVEINRYFLPVGVKIYGRAVDSRQHYLPLSALPYTEQTGPQHGSCCLPAIQQ